MSVARRTRTAAAKMVEISTLPNDCLRAIFLHLTVLERNKLRKVCRQWKDVSDDCWSEVESLSVEGGCSKNEVDGDGRKVEVLAKSKKFALKITELCAPHMKKFRFCDSAEFDLFPALVNARKIEDLMYLVDDEDDAKLGKLFTKNPNMKKVKLKMCKTHRCLNRLKTGSLKSLEIKAHDYLMDRGRKRFMEILAKKVGESPLLESLDLYNLNDDAVLEALEGNVNLRELYIWENDDLFTLDGLHSIVKLPNLRKFTIHVFDTQLIRDDFLWNLSANCVELEFLSISEVKKITDRGLEALSHLPKLKQLGMNEVSKITDAGLLYLTNMEKLGIWESKVTTEGVIELIRNSSTLCSLGLSSKNVNVNKLKQATAKILKKRETPLSCYVNSVHICGEPAED